jgi:peptide-methionine (R)-S-oxide reductase
MIFLWIFLLAQHTKETLGAERYHVMREKGTERAFSGKYLYESAPGTYICAACKLPLFDSKDKYDSGSGWPSFKKPIASKNIYYLEDRGLPIKRYEVLCKGCDSHLGHVFHDGPPPKELRYCINSITLIFDKRI